MKKTAPALSSSPDASKSFNPSSAKKPPTPQAKKKAFVAANDGGASANLGAEAVVDVAELGLDIATHLPTRAGKAAGTISGGGGDFGGAGASGDFGGGAAGDFGDAAANIASDAPGAVSEFMEAAGEMLSTAGSAVAEGAGAVIEGAGAVVGGIAEVAGDILSGL